MDLISRQAAIAYAISGLTREIDGEKWIRVSEVRESIKELPSAPPEMKRGKWIWVDGVRCSECNYKLQSTGLPSFCPNCGAEMGERREDAT